ncbi:MAG: tyrosine-type recombinase/integrase [Clostridia bacterium]|nr:tyrosine-type recombinase/integrase [Clostridia bacterium]
MQKLVDYDELPTAVRNFVSYKLTVQGRSQKTMDEYALDLRTFFRFLSVKRDGMDVKSMGDDDFAAVDISGIDMDFIGSVTTEEVYDFLYYVLEARGNKWSARARKLSALKSFYKYLTVSARAIDNDPTKNIDGPQKKKTLPKFLSLEESESLLEAVRADEASKTRERDFCILVLFLNCGMRLSELVGINLSDIDRNMESLRVLGKGAKERMIYLNDACRDALRSYLRVRAADEVQIKDRNALFLSSRHTRISNKTVQWVVGKYLKAAGLEHKHFSTHKLRHTAATLMYQSGNVDVRVLKDILGHEQLNTTQIYTHVSDEGMRKAMAANPLANFKAKGNPTQYDEEE